MVVANVQAESTTDTAMFLRLWDRQKLTPTLARHLLNLGWSTEDESRIHELSEKNREGQIKANEERELENYLRIGTMLSILQSRARKALKATAKRASRP